MKPTLEKIWSLDILNIEADSDLLFWFLRYKCLKTHTIFPNFTLFPKFWENQTFAEHAVFTKMSPLLTSTITQKIKKIH